MPAETDNPPAAPAQEPLTRWVCACAYDGTDFLGWQSQAGGNTIQDYIETRLAALFKRPVRIHGSGRTDSGVHAKAQVFHFDAHWPHPVEHLLRALRSGLPAGIQVYRVRRAPPGFHARYDATGKRYIYRMHLGWASPMEARYCWSLGARRPDLALMRDAASRLLGTHDFTAFGALRSGASEQDSPVKDLRRLDLTLRGRKLTLTTEASGYLYKMVRTLTGTLVEVGLGKLTPDDVERILRSRVRTPAIVTAPAHGLMLDRVWYPPTTRPKAP